MSQNDSMSAIQRLENVGECSGIISDHFRDLPDISMARSRPYFVFTLYSSFYPILEQYSINNNTLLDPVLVLIEPDQLPRPK